MIETILRKPEDVEQLGGMLTILNGLKTAIPGFSFQDAWLVSSDRPEVLALLKLLDAEETPVSTETAEVSQAGELCPGCNRKRKLTKTGRCGTAANRIGGRTATGWGETTRTRHRAFPRATG